MRSSDLRTAESNTLLSLPVERTKAMIIQCQLEESMSGRCCYNTASIKNSSCLEEIQGIIGRI